MGIIIVEPTSSGFTLVEAARQMGEAAFVFAQDEQQIPAYCRRFASAIVEVDTNDVQAVVCAARRIEKDAQSEDEKIRGILPGFEYTVDVVARVASQLGLPHLSMQAAALTRNKFACRERLKAQGLDVPRYALISDFSELERAASEVGFPAVLKPVDGSGSLLVRRIDSLAQLRSVLADPVNTSLLDMGRQIGSQLLLEEYVEGREFSIEGYIDQGQPHIVTITEKQLGPEPFFVEMGHVVPAKLQSGEQQALVAYIEKVACAIGLDLGVFHAEARITKRGPILIEIAARLGGDRIYRLVELTSGLSLPKTMIRSHCAMPEPAFIDPLYQCRNVAGVRFLSCNGNGRFGGASGLDQVRAMDGYEEADLYCQAGDDIPELTDFRGRIGHILFCADDRSTLDVRLAQAESKINLLPQVQQRARYGA